MKRVLFTNGHVWQSQRQQQLPASWVLISQPEDNKDSHGKILAVGAGDPPNENREDADVIDLEGAIMLPGLQDSHVHVGCMGESAHYVELSGCNSVAEVQETLKQHAENNPDLPWLIGTGWDQNLWSPAKPLTKRDLDACLPDGRPCLLYRRCWHAVAVNSAALRAAGIDPEKPWSPVTSDDDGSDNSHDRDIDNDKITPPFPSSAGGKGEPEAAEAAEAAETGSGRGTEKAREVGDGVAIDGAGRPTGLFREGSMRIVESAITAPSFEMRCEQFAEALERCVRSGLTAVHSNDENAIQVYARLQEEGRLPVRVYLTLPHEELEKEYPAAGESGGGGVGDGCDEDKQATEISGRKPKPWSGDKGLVSWNRVKLFSDGSLGAETAAMRLPYLNTDNKGMLIHEPATLARKVTQARDRGFRVEVHAIGDRALASVLDAFEGAGLKVDDRPIVTHCQVAGPDLVARMQNIGAVAAVQPSFVPSDAAVVKKRLSPSVHPSCYPWRSLLKGGVTCAGSSDAPIETHNPFRGIYDAVFRPDSHASSAVTPLSEDALDTKSGLSCLDEAAACKETKNSTGGGTVGGGDGGGGGGGVSPFLPNERLTLEEAVWMYTTGGAIAAGAEDRLGAIQPGFLADFTVMEVQGGGEKLLENPSLILEAKVSQVWVGGLCRWEKVDDSRGGTPDSSGKEEKGAASSSPSLLSGSAMSGKNGPKRKRRVSSGERNGSSNPWLSGGIGRMGRCRCCS